MATFFNQATLSYRRGVVNSNITQGELLAVLSVTKTAIVGEYSRNSHITYAVNIINSGNTSFTGISVKDTLGSYSVNGDMVKPLDYIQGSIKYFINGVLQTAPTVSVGSCLVFSCINIPANAVATLIYTVQVNRFAPLSEGALIENTVIVGCGTNSVVATETVNASENPELLIVKSLNPTTVTQSDRVTYTVTIQNIGNTPATIEDNVVITDLFNPILSDVIVTYNGEQWSEPSNYTYNKTTGLFQSASGQITVPAATYSVNDENGEWIVNPGIAILTITGTV